MRDMKLTFPEIFITGELDEDRPDKALVADALVGWANCMAGSGTPKMFLRGMAAIGKKLGIEPTPDNIKKLAAEIIAK